MTLKKLVESVDNRITENFSTGLLWSRSTPTQKKVIEEHNDFVTAIGIKLKDYCKFYKSPQKEPGSRTMGRVPDRYWGALIETNVGKSIEIDVTQKYIQPGVRISQADVVLKYDPEITKTDIGIVRRAITSSGLNKI